MNFLNNLFLKGQLYLAAAPGGNFLGKISKAIGGLDSGVADIGNKLAVLMIIVLGVVWMSGRAGAQWAKGQLGRVICGIAFVVLAADVVAWVMGVFG